MTPHGLPKYTVDADTGCWNWMLHTSPFTGYGIRTVDGKRWSAHRHAYVERYGDLAAEYDVHHLCHNRRCVNPEHLEAILRDEHAGARGHGKLTRSSASEIRELYARGDVTQKNLAVRFNVVPSVVSRIVSGHIWKAAEQPPTPDFTVT